MAKHKTESAESFGHWLLQVFILAIIIIGLYLVVFRFLLANETISGPSMQPTFENNDRVIAVRHSKLSRGDIVILKPQMNQVPYILKELLECLETALNQKMM